MCHSEERSDEEPFPLSFALSLCHSEEQSDEESFLRRYCEDPSHSLRMTEKETMFGIDGYTLSCHSDTNHSGVRCTPE